MSHVHRRARWATSYHPRRITTWHSSISPSRLVRPAMGSDFLRISARFPSSLCPSIARSGVRWRWALWVRLHRPQPSHKCLSLRHHRRPRLPPLRPSLNLSNSMSMHSARVNKSRGGSPQAQSRIDEGCNSHRRCIPRGIANLDRGVVPQHVRRNPWTSADRRITMSTAHQRCHVHRACSTAR
jgi:hypothetical protein